MKKRIELLIDKLDNETIEDLLAEFIMDVKSKEGDVISTLILNLSENEEKENDQ